MALRHWTDDELIAHLYEMGPEDGHLEACAECAARWQQLLARREELRAPLPLDEVQLFRQRQAVYEAAQARPARRWVHYGLAAAASAAVFAIALSVSRLAGPPAPVTEGPPAISDSELLADVYSLVHSSEPAALEPVRALFEEVEP
ncbi:MAG: hypothetical protein K6T61_03650 [Bryobacteraceae bacterium]|nr:hypothetical protein [Bryobacteraceae bacterium]